MSASIDQAVLRLPPLTEEPGMPQGFSAGYSIGKRHERLVNSQTDGQHAFQQVFDPYKEAWEKLIGTPFINPADNRFGGWKSRLSPSGWLQATSVAVDDPELQRIYLPVTYQQRIDRINEGINAFNDANPDEQFPLPLIDPAQIEQDVYRLARDTHVEMAAFDKAATTAGWWGGATGSMVGWLAEFIRDPIAPVVATAPLGIARKANEHWATLALRRALAGGAFAGGEEAYLQARPGGIWNWRKEIGLPMSYRESGVRIAAAFAGGTVFTGAADLTILLGTTSGRAFLRNQRVLRFVEQAAELRKRAANKRSSPEEVAEFLRKAAELNRRAAQNIDDPDLVLAMDELIHANPKVRDAAEVGDATETMRNAARDRDRNPLADFNAHMEAVDRLGAVADGHFVSPVNLAGVPLKRPQSTHDGSIDQTLHSWSPDQLTVDPSVFQFKSAARGEEGLTGALSGVSTWETERANLIIVYERAAKEGEEAVSVVVDGHQRLNLAKRLHTAENPIQIYGTLYREVDGFTPEFVRVRAALKNISESSASAIDAAIILRNADGMEINLPPASKLYQHAQGLSRLTDDAFGYIQAEANTGGLDERFGAVVGHLVEDQSMQLAMLDLLNRLQPSTSMQAESIIRQALAAGAARKLAGRQAGLFGDDEIKETLFLERAKVLEKALRIVTSDRSLFAKLEANEARIQAQAGNVLNREANQEIIKNARTVQQSLAAEANHAGAVSDALQAAAQQLRDGSALASVAEDFVDIVRQRIDRGDFGRAPTGGDGGVGQSPAASAEIPDGLDIFSDPHTGPGPAGQAAEFEAELEASYPKGDDAESRLDLQRHIEAGASLEALMQHPAVLNASAKMEEIPNTNEVEGYSDWLWKQQREYHIDGQIVTGYKEAVDALYQSWKKMWSEGEYGEVITNANRDADLPELMHNKFALIVLGPPASGKSHFAEKLALHRRAMIIDPDEVKKVLPEYAEGVGASATHKESSDMTKDIIDRAMEDGANMVIPRTGAIRVKGDAFAKDIDKLVTTLKGDGYTTHVVSMHVEQETPIRRALNRFVESGRFVNPEFLIGIGDGPEKTFKHMKKRVDAYAQIENESARDAPKQVRFEELGNPLAAYAGRDNAFPVSRDQRGLWREFGEDDKGPEGLGPGTIEAVRPEDQLIPFERVSIDEAGAETINTVLMSRSDILEDFQQDDSMLERLSGCVPK